MRSSQSSRQSTTAARVRGDRRAAPLLAGVRGGLRPRVQAGEAVRAAHKLAPTASSLPVQGWGSCRPALPHSPSPSPRPALALLPPAAGNTGAVLLLDSDFNMHFRTFLPPAEAAQPGLVGAEQGLLPREPPPTQQPAPEGQGEQQQPAAAAGRAGQQQAQPPCEGGGQGGPPELRRASSGSERAELVAREEVAEDSRALGVHHQRADGGSGQLAGGGDAAAACEGSGGAAWRYALPRAEAVVGGAGA